MRDVCEATGKLQYQSKQAADKAIRVHSSQIRRSYKCEHCNRWHLTKAVAQ